MISHLLILNAIKIICLLKNSDIKNKYKKKMESHTLSLHLEITTLNI